MKTPDWMKVAEESGLTPADVAAENLSAEIEEQANGFREFAGDMLDTLRRLRNELD